MFFHTVVRRSVSYFRNRRPVHGSVSKSKRNEDSLRCKLREKKGVNKVLSHLEIDKIIEDLDPYGERMSNLSEDVAESLDEYLPDEPDMNEIIRLPDGDPIYARYVAATKSKQGRRKSGNILVEGKRLIYDVLQSGGHCRSIFFTHKHILEDLTIPRACKVFQVSPKSFSLWSDVQTPQGIMGVFEIPDPTKFPYERDTINPITVICDNVKDPGNMGSMIRLAAASGCCELITAQGCVDVWQPKVIRSGMAGHFKIPIFKSMSWKNIFSKVPEESVVLLADTESKVNDVSESDRCSDSSDMIKAILERKDSKEELAKAVSSMADEENCLDIYRYVPMDVMSYTELCSEFNRPNIHFTVIIGGETFGISLYARKLAIERPTCRIVNIPMCNTMDSLNNSIALGIILFELKKLFCT